MSARVKRWVKNCGIAVAVVVNDLADLVWPIETSGLNPFYSDGGSTEWLGDQPDNLRRCGGEPRSLLSEPRLSGRTSGGTSSGVSCIDPSTRTQAPESPAGDSPLPAGEVPGPSSPPDKAADSGQPNLIDDIASVLAGEFAQMMVSPLGQPGAADGFWEYGLDDDGREVFRNYAWALLGQFTVARK